jgi:hypothetical protein
MTQRDVSVFNSVYLETFPQLPDQLRGPTGLLSSGRGIKLTTPIEFRGY